MRVKDGQVFPKFTKRQASKSEMNNLITNGVETNELPRIRCHVQNKFQQLYNHESKWLRMNFWNNMFTVGQNVNDNINADITMQELWFALKLQKTTTPSPDRISNTNLKKLWDIIGLLIVDAWKYSINHKQTYVISQELTAKAHTKSC